MYGRLDNGVFRPAPRRIDLDDAQIYNPTAAQYEAAGYLPVRQTAAPTAPDGYEAFYEWQEQDGQIVQVWTLRPAEELDDDSPATASMLAATEDAMTATRNYDAGDLMSVSGVLYAVTAAIPNGGAITPGVNVTPTTMAEQLALLADKKS